MSFRALMLEKQDGWPLAHIVDLDDAALSTPEALANDVTAGDVLIRVDWSTINYKDGLAITGRGPVVRPRDTQELGAADFADQAARSRMVDAATEADSLSAMHLLERRLQALRADTAKIALRCGALGRALRVSRD